MRLDSPYLIIPYRKWEKETLLERRLESTPKNDWKPLSLCDIFQKFIKAQKMSKSSQNGQQIRFFLLI